MDVVARLIQHEAGGYLGVDGKRIDRSYVSVPVPDEPYQVIFVLSETGKYKVDNLDTAYAWISAEGLQSMAVCFIPRSWRGKRLNRYVVPLSAAYGG